MFGLGVPELIFILLLALLIFGPKKLPEIGRTLGKGMSEFRKASNELTRSINAELSLDEQPAPPQVRRMSPAMDDQREVRSASPLIAAVPPLPAQTADEAAPAPVRTDAPPPPIEPS
jgi:sec-independent protein translocase protein TatA